MSNVKYAIVRSEGEYSDRREDVVLIVSTVATAEIKVQEFTNNIGIEIAKKKVIYDFESKELENRPLHNFKQPFYDNSILDKKQARIDHQKAIDEYGEKSEKWYKEIFNPWLEKHKEKIKNFENSIDISTLVPMINRNDDISYFFTEADYLDE